jgi:hypothetical protein
VPKFACSLQQHGRPLHISTASLDRLSLTLCELGTGEVNDGLCCFGELPNQSPISDIPGNQAKPWIATQVCELRLSPIPGPDIQDRQLDLGVGAEAVAHEGGANEAGAPRYQQTADPGTGHPPNSEIVTKEKRKVPAGSFVTLAR